MLISNKTIELGIYLLVFLLPIQTRLIIRPGEVNGRYSEYLTVSLYATDLLFVGLLGLEAVLSLRGAKRQSNPEADGKTTGLLRSARNDKVFWLFLAWSASSILWAPDKLLTLQFVFRLALVGGLFRMLVSKTAESPASGRRDFAEASSDPSAGGGPKGRKLAWAFLLGLVLPASFAIYQFFVQAAPANKWLGLAAHVPFDLGQSVIETTGGSHGASDSGRWLRAYGTFDHPNILGAAMSLGIVLTLFLYTGSKRAWPRLAALTLVPFLAFALFFSFSRSAWLALTLGLAWAAFSFQRQSQWQNLKAALYFVLLLGAQAFILNDLTPDLVATRFTAQARLEQKSLAERGDSYRAGWALARENPIKGGGAGSYILSLAGRRPDELAYSLQPPHNTYLLAWAECGLVGLFLLGILAIKYLKQGKDRPEFAMILMVLFLMLFDHWWWSLHFGLIFLAFWLIIYKLNINKIK
jgi:O-antigen ligase